MEPGDKFRIYPTPEHGTLIRKTLGCARYVYNYYLNKRQELYMRGDKPDEHFLRAYYSDESNDTTLSLFAAYFVPEFTNEDTARAALETAVCLTELILSEYDIEEYRAEAFSAPLRQKWLEQLDIGAAGSSGIG